MANNNTVLLWFRNDLRLTDNQALTEALQAADHVIPVYILNGRAGKWPMGSASRWWLHHSLAQLDNALQTLGSRLIIREGDELKALESLLTETGARGVYWNRLYTPALIERDRLIKSSLREQGHEVKSFKGNVLFEPFEIVKDNGTPYRVFTPYWKAMQKCGLNPAILDAPQSLPPVPASIESRKLEALGLLPKIPWDQGFYTTWEVGEAGAQKQLDHFIQGTVNQYHELRDFPAREGTSKISPHLAFGEISPTQILNKLLSATGSLNSKGSEHFLREVGWREFAYHLLFHFPNTDAQPLDERFDNFEWSPDYQEELKAWQKGQTGIPIVDAGMRELWHTGWMHNRVRMIVASLLTKNLLIPWQEGAYWFWDTLVDADLASNSLGWQWVAGCGADAAPYFRIFNPILQGEKFDAEGHYVRRWVPELTGLDNKWLHQPWLAPEIERRHIRNYPSPIVDLAYSRERALAAYGRVRKYPAEPGSVVSTTNPGSQP